MMGCVDGERKEKDVTKGRKGRRWKQVDEGMCEGKEEGGL